MTSYRESHLGQGKGAWYDEVHGKKIDALIWEDFVKPQLTAVFADSAREGARRYLDFACGTGRVLKVGSAHFSESVGVDISPDMLTVAKERVPTAQFHCVDVTRTPDAVSGTFDCVSLFRFLLNAEKPLRDEVLQWIGAHTRPGAVLVGNNHMETTSISGLLTVAANALINRRRHHLSRRQVEAMLGRAGFVVERWNGYRVLPSVMGRPLLGRALQPVAERAAVAAGLGRFGVEQIFVARKR